ncbi:LapA family protein [Nitrosococcus wardiae]|uniref:LapA family protein n=1 Tax=Nitrosococcus wardiae TaxID=1814290 RepID=A0A4P7BZT2_9GAMM|nr:LapA family protein [Nitrosococcus wardiae]QBQ54867.1 LapA family protein [Nitrosococcus wardiae]
MRRLFYFLIFIVVFVLGLTFAGRHAEPVMIDYHFGQLHVPLSLLLALILMVGAILGMFASLGTIMKLKRENGRLRKSIKWVEKENANLRAITVKHEQ